MGTISARVPEDLEEDLEKYLEAERLDRSTAIRKLLAERLADWRIERALERLEAGEITFSRAVELAAVDHWELARIAADQEITWVGSDGLEADLEEF